VKTYSSKEAAYYAGLSVATLKDLLRIHNGKARFNPDIPSNGIKGKPRAFTENDLIRLKEYNLRRIQIVKLNKEIQDILKG
jgi:hypothetical protein